MPLVLERSRQESINNFTEVFHDLLFNIHCDKSQNKAPKGRVVGYLVLFCFLFERDVWIQSLGCSIQCSVRLIYFRCL